MGWEALFLLALVAQIGRFLGVLRALKRVITREVGRMNAHASSMLLELTEVAFSDC